MRTSAGMKTYELKDSLIFPVAQLVSDVEPWGSFDASKASDRTRLYWFALSLQISSAR